MLTEVAQRLTKRVGLHLTRIFVRAASRLPLTLIAVSRRDLVHVDVIMSQYQYFDFFDSCIIAVAEHLNVVRIATFDRRGFSVFVPQHCEHLELLP